MKPKTKQKIKPMYCYIVKEKGSDYVSGSYLTYQNALSNRGITERFRVIKCEIIKCLLTPISRKKTK